MQHRVSVIIPAFNEEASIGTVIAEIRQWVPDYEIVVVDDGSTDATAQVAAAAGAQVIKHPYNMGNGAAVKTGVKHASGDYLLMMDADGQHSPSDIQKLVAGLDQYDMVIGARSAGAPVSSFRTFGNRIFVILASYLAGRNIPDLTSGFRAVKRQRMLEFLHLLPNKFSYPSTITMALLKTGYPVQHVPLTTVVKRKKGKSKINPLGDGLLFLLVIVRMGMLFDPLKLFLPASGILLASGIALAICQIWRVNTITNSAVLLVISAVIIFFVGLLADQLAHLRRELNLLHRLE